MVDFTRLYVELDQTNKTNEKVDALVRYFSSAEPEDAAWAFYFLSGRKPRQIVPSAKLREWAIALSQTPEWLFLASRDTVGDTAETIALLLPNTAAIDDTQLHILVENELIPLRGKDAEHQHQVVTTAWSKMSSSQRLVYNKLISGSFRVGVSQLLVVRAISQITNIPKDVILHRAMGNWEPSRDFYLQNYVRGYLYLQILRDRKFQRSPEFPPRSWPLGFFDRSVAEAQ